MIIKAAAWRETGTSVDTMAETDELFGSSLAVPEPAFWVSGAD